MLTMEAKEEVMTTRLTDGLFFWIALRISPRAVDGWVEEVTLVVFDLCLEGRGGE
jgi:hypothetical protein